jgi:hypothetical protein
MADEKTTQDEETSTDAEEPKVEQSRWDKLDEQDSPPEEPEKRSYSDTYMGTGGSG